MLSKRKVAKSDKEIAADLIKLEKEEAIKGGRRPHPMASDPSSQQAARYRRYPIGTRRVRGVGKGARRGPGARD